MNNKLGFILAIILMIAIQPAVAQNLRKSAKISPETVQLYNVIDADQEALRIKDATYQGSRIDTSLTITNTATRLSSLIDTLTLSFIYIYNNTAGATLYVGSNSEAINNGIPVSYQGSFTDDIGFYDSTIHLWLVSSAESANVRVKLIYR